MNHSNKENLFQRLSWRESGTAQVCARNQVMTRGVDAGRYGQDATTRGYFLCCPVELDPWHVGCRGEHLFGSDVLRMFGQIVRPEHILVLS